MEKEDRKKLKKTRVVSLALEYGTLVEAIQGAPNEQTKFVVADKTGDRVLADWTHG